MTCEPTVESMIVVWGPMMRRAADARAAAKRGAGLDHARRARSRRRRRSRWSAGSMMRHAVEHVALVDPLAGDLVHRRQLGAVVDADVHRDVVDPVDDHAPAVLAHELQRVADVVLARGVVVGDAAERVGERLGVEGEGVRVDLVDGEDLRRGIPSGYLVSTIRSKSPLASRTTRPSDSASSRSTLTTVAAAPDSRVRAIGVLERLGRHQRVVAVHDDHRLGALRSRRAPPAPRRRSRRSGSARPSRFPREARTRGRARARRSRTRAPRRPRAPRAPARPPSGARKRDGASSAPTSASESPRRRP